MSETDWKIFTGRSAPHDGILKLLEDETLCPPWRNFQKRFQVAAKAGDPLQAIRNAPEETDDRGEKFLPDKDMIEIVNAALYLRRPLLITGKPGTGKSSLIYAVARELKLGKVLRWPITSRSTLQQSLYQYDAIGRLQETQLTKQTPDIGKYLRLGPLGTALLPSRRPRALLVDEIDKSDVDLPNDLLNIFEEGEYEIPELVRLREQEREIQVRPYDEQQLVPIIEGRVRCLHFPFVILTSNGEREFPAPFLRRCLRLEVGQDDKALKRIVTKHLGAQVRRQAQPIIQTFLKQRNEEELATDQLLNAIFLIARASGLMDSHERDHLVKALLKALNEDKAK